jgi:hypothetical protein
MDLPFIKQLAAGEYGGGEDVGRVGGSVAGDQTGAADRPEP